MQVEGVDAINLEIFIPVISKSPSILFSKLIGETMHTSMKIADNGYIILRPLHIATEQIVTQ